MAKAKGPKKATKQPARRAAPKAAPRARPPQPADPLAADPAEVDRLVRAFDRGVCVQVSFGALGVRRRVDVERVDDEGAGVSVKVATGRAPARSDADLDDDEAGDRLRVHKVVLRCPEYAAIRRTRRAVKRLLATRALPTILGKAMYVVPVRDYKRTVGEMDDLIGRLRGEVETYIERYGEIKLQQKRRLGRLYDDADYPPPDAVRAALWVRVRRGFRIAAPENLRAVDVEAFELAAADLRREQAEAAAEMRAMLRAAFADVVGHLADRLTGKTADGRPAVLRDAAVKNVEEFVALFDTKDLTLDTGLRAEVDRVRKLLAGVDLEAVRDDGALRAQFGKQVAAAKAAIDPLVEAAPLRRVRWAAPKGGA